jgi:MFS family permease
VSAVRTGDRRARLLTPALVFVTLVVAVISSLGAPLIPLISRDLHVPLSDAQWSLTAALLAGAVSAPIMGRLGDGPHRREAIACGLGVVLLGGILAALAGSLPVLVVGRAMQGVGLGLVPLAMAAARDGLPAREVPPAIALLSVSAAGGVGAGYPVSGLIAEHLDLHAAFWFGAGFSAIALVAVLAVVPPSRGRRGVPLDLRGAALLSGGLIALLLAVGQGERWGWGSATILALLAAAAVLLCAWVVQQSRAAHPLVELRLLRRRAVLTADASAFVLGAAMYLYLSVVTAFVQAPPGAGYGFGASVLTAGLCLVPFSITSLIASRLLPAATRLLGPRGVLPVGCLVVAGAGAFFALAHGALWEAFAAMAIVGVGIGFTFAAIPGLIVRAVPAEETGSAMGFYQVVRYIGFSLGSALAASILAGHTPAGAHLPTEAGYEMALWAAAGLCLAAAVLAWVLPAGAGPASPALRRLEAEDAELGAAGVVGLEGSAAQGALRRFTAWCVPRPGGRLRSSPWRSRSSGSASDRRSARRARATP